MPCGTSMLHSSTSWGDVQCAARGHAWGVVTVFSNKVGELVPWTKQCNVELGSMVDLLLKPCVLAKTDQSLEKHYQMRRDTNKLVQVEKRELNEELYSCIYQKFKVSPGTGQIRANLLIPRQSKSEMHPSRDCTGELLKDLSCRHPGREEEYSKLQEDFLESEDMRKGQGVSNFISEDVQRQHTGVVMCAGDAYSKDDRGWEDTDCEEDRASNSFLRGASVGSELLIAELQEASDTLEDMENTVQIKLMVSEAVLKGIVSALENDASEAVEAKEAELQRVKEQLLEKDSIVTRLINTLQRKEDELAKLVEESKAKERRLMLDMLTERERVLGKVKESEEFISSKEKEILKIAESMMQLAVNLDEESKTVIQLEKQLNESKEAETSKGKEMMEMIAEKDSLLEMVRREARLKELRWTESLEERDRLISDQRRRLKNLESAEHESSEGLQIQSEEVTLLALSEKDSSAIVKSLTIGSKGPITDPEAKEESLKFLQDEIAVYNDRVQKLAAEKSKLDEELSSHRAELEARENELVKQKTALQEARLEIEMFALSEAHLRQEMLKMSLELQETASSCKVKLEDQNLLHEFQTSLIMETVKGILIDVAKEISLLEEDLAEKQTRSLTFESNILQRHHAELSNLQSSTVALEQKLEESHAVIKSFEKTMEEKDKMLEDKVQMLHQAEDAISHLEGKLIQEEVSLHNYRNSAEAAKFHEESMKQYQKKLEENAQKLREAEERIYFLEHELVSEKFRVQTGIEEKAWRVDFEEQFVCAYVENLFEGLLKHIAEVQENLVNVHKKLVDNQNELEAARIQLTDSKAQIQSLNSDIIASSKFVDGLHTETNSHLPDSQQATVECYEASLESKKGKDEFNEGWKKTVIQKQKLEEKIHKNRAEVTVMLEKLEESEWKSHVEALVVLGLVGGSTREMGQEVLRLREEIKLKHQEVLTLQSEVEEQNLKLSSHATEMSNLRIALLSKDEELRNLRRDSELVNAVHQDALMQEQSRAREALKEIGDLKELKVTLTARIKEEEQRVQQLECALAEQRWKHQVEIDTVGTVLWRGGVGKAANWHKEKAVLVSEIAQLQQKLRERKHDSNIEALKKLNHYARQSSDVEVKVKEESVPQERVEISSLGPESIMFLERQNSELRREKEQLLEQKTDEIYRLKREFYKELEKFKGETKYDSELANLKSLLKGERDVAGEPNECKCSVLEKKVMSDHQKDSEIRVGWDSEKSTLLETISQRDERIKERDECIEDVSNRLSHALEKEKKHVSTRASLVENLAALEKERNRLNSVHEREKEKLTVFYKKLLEEKEIALSRASKDIEEKCRQISLFEIESRRATDEITALRTEMMAVRKQLKIDLARQIQALFLSSQQLESEVFKHMKQYILRLEAVQHLVKCLLRQFSMLSLNETDNLQNVQNLQKAEAEVDLLGDEVDALMDVMEKVYTVLNHYAPVIQHYPGLAELVKVVRQEVLQRLCDSEDV